MLRVAQIMGQMNGGGVEAAVMNYYRHIDRTRVQFDLIVDSDSTMIPREEIESLGGKVLLVPPLKDLRAYRMALGELFAHEAWPIVHSHRNTLSVFPLQVAKASDIPIRIAHSHSTSGRGEHAKNAVKFVLKQFSNIYPTNRLACSEYAGRWLYGKKAKFDVMYNAIELDRFSYSVESRIQIRTELGISDKALVVGHVGRFMPQKNHLFLLKAFERLAQIRGDAILLLAGDGEQKGDAEKWVHDHGLSTRVRFLGQRNDMQRLYSGFDVFALPSLYEGLCLVGIEALHAGLPCFLSDTITREIDLTGTVRFLPIANYNTWADELAQIHPGERLSVNDNDFERYDINKASYWLLDYYERLYDAENQRG